MDPALDPSPFSAQSTGAFPPADAPAAANPTPAHSVPINHPPYAEMITAAIGALNERDGSSKRAIAKYIETHYPALPPNPAQLTNQLKRLKGNGQLVMVKKSYALPTRSTAAAVNGDVNAVAADPGASGSKRRPGRPPKSDAGQAAVPVFASTINMNAEPVASPVAAGAHIAVGPAGAPGRGRGRPPKRGLQSGGVGKPRGRPKKNAITSPALAPATAPAAGSGRPRGRPPKPINAVQGTSVSGGIPGVSVPVGGKRRGRPSKASGVAKKPRKLRQLSGKPLGRPRKNAAATAANDTPDRKLVDSYINLNNELDALKTKVKDTVNTVRPFLYNDGAIAALNELEALAQGASAPQGAPVPPQQPQPQS